MSRCTAKITISHPTISIVAIGNPERHVHKASHCGSKQQQRSSSQSLLLLLARATYIMVLFFTHIPFVVNHIINATPPERLQHYACVSSEVIAWAPLNVCLSISTTYLSSCASVDQCVPCCWHVCLTSLRWVWELRQYAIHSNISL